MSLFVKRFHLIFIYNHNSFDVHCVTFLGKCNTLKIMSMLLTQHTYHALDYLPNNKILNISSIVQAPAIYLFNTLYALFFMYPFKGLVLGILQVVVSTLSTRWHKSGKWILLCGQVRYFHFVFFTLLQVTEVENDIGPVQEDEGPNAVSQLAKKVCEH